MFLEDKAPPPPHTQCAGHAQKFLNFASTMLVGDIVFLDQELTVVCISSHSY